MELRLIGPQRLFHRTRHELFQWSRRSLFARVLQFDPMYLTAYFQKGRTLINAGRVPEARAALSAGISAAQSLGGSHTESEMQAMLDTIG